MRLFAATAAAVLAGVVAPAVSSAQTPDPFPALADAGVSTVITSLPFERYAPEDVKVSRSMGVRYANLDTAFHDVVALEDTRPHGSAAWCENYPPDPEDLDKETCPLFWTPLIPGGGTDPATVPERKNDTWVQGLEDTELGETYKFYCSIHPLMVGTIEVIE
jgi:plastocyanin